MMKNDADLTARAAVLGQHLEARQWRLVTAESCTGGWIAKVITDVAGSSAWFDRGFITYSNAAKQELLNVSAELLTSDGAVSRSVVAAMVRGALLNSAADIGVAVSGIAGPGGGSVNKPVGTVCLAWAYRQLPNAPIECTTRTVWLHGERDQIRHNTVRLALARLIIMATRSRLLS